MSGLLSRAKHEGGGPTPKLGNQGTLVPMMANQVTPIPFGEPQPHQRVMALSLVTCAAVCFASTHPSASPVGVVYHANSGVLLESKMNEVMNELGNPPITSVIVVYTYPGPPSQGLYDDAMSLETKYSIPPNNIVYMPSLPIINFGFNWQAHVGV